MLARLAQKHREYTLRENERNDLYKSGYRELSLLGFALTTYVLNLEGKAIHRMIENQRVSQGHIDGPALAEFIVVSALWWLPCLINTGLGLPKLYNNSLIITDALTGTRLSKIAKKNPHGVHKPKVKPRTHCF